jgi:hypothetical protein
VTGAGSSGRAAGGPAAAAVTADAGAGRRGARRGVWLAAAAGVAVVAAVAGVAAAGAAGAFGGAGAPASSSAYPTSTAVVARRSLTSQDEVDGTLGRAGSCTVVNGAPGTFTALPAAGQVVREGQVLYQVNGSPVLLLYGTVPAWRALAAGVTGPDVTELNADLVQLGYASAALLGPRSGWDYFSAETGYALGLLQSRLGASGPDGSLPLGAAVFLPGAVLVTGLGPGVVAGGPAMPGSVVLTGTSLTPVVTVDLGAGQQTEVSDGDQVSVTLPDGVITPGVVSSVGAVASGPGGTVAVLVALKDPAAAGQLDQAPVQVTLTTGAVRNVLVVPVDALLAQPAGYAVEVTGPAGHHLVAVSVGLFDDAAGLVQVTGSGLAAGQRVVVPAI